ncbi:DUF4249 domain-containing protein [Maribacter sp. X9]|uniref:DUF4249 domain-containing protein n=1 Tax=Maribacter sp. X9 TaxID=3402159 RepID=UPI003AF381EE
MKRNGTNLIKKWMAIAIGLFLASCIEPFEPEALEFTSALVIEATITDENNYQEILISRTFELDTTGLYREKGAKVSVTGSDGSIYDFNESGNGVYVSDVSFGAKRNVSYQLNFTTADGNSYKSDKVTTPQPTEIERLYAERDFKDGDVNEGMFIYVDSYDPTGANQYYRYEYEETYKIIAPFWSPADAFVVQPFPDPVFETRPRTREERICYNTLVSKNVIQENTLNFSENRISKFPVRFISRNDYMLSHRYSILVKQYVQTSSAFSYYEKVRVLSESSSLFSQIQTGFLEGNIKSTMNSEEKVIGFFETSSVSEKRIYFNYEDYFAGERLPDFVVACEPLAIPVLEGIPIPSHSPLQDAIENGSFKFYNDNKGDNGDVNRGAPYLMVPTTCSDCTQLGSNIVPDFWEED